MASLLFLPEEIAIILEVDVADFDDALQDETSPAYRAYQKGKLSTKMALRKTIITQAKQGSSPAQTMALRILDDLESHEP